MAGFDASVPAYSDPKDLPCTLTRPCSHAPSLVHCVFWFGYCDRFCGGLDVAEGAVRHSPAATRAVETGVTTPYLSSPENPLHASAWGP